MQVEIKKIERDYLSLRSKRIAFIDDWANNSSERLYGKSSTQEEKWNSLMELQKDSTVFRDQGAKDLFDFRIELLCSVDIENRVKYVNECIRGYAEETIKITIFIDKSMRDTPLDIESIKLQKSKEWNPGGWDRTLSAMNTLYISIFYDLDLPVERRYKLESLQEQRKRYDSCI